jgi:hypothetical protein
MCVDSSIGLVPIGMTGIMMFVIGTEYGELPQVYMKKC